MKMPRLIPSDVPTRLAIIVSVAWMASLIFRFTHPDWATGTGVDALMAMIIAYYFSANAIRKMNGGS